MVDKKRADTAEACGAAIMTAKYAGLEDAMADERPGTALQPHCKHDKKDVTSPIVRRRKTPLPPSPICVDNIDVAFNEFLPAALQVIATPPSLIYRVIAYLLCGGITCAIIGSIFSFLHIFAIAPGQYQPRGGPQVVEPREAGQVKLVSVVNGDRVKKGDVVVVLDPTAALAAQTIIKAKLGDFRAEIARRQVAIRAAAAPNIDKDIPIIWNAGVGVEVRARQETVLRADLSQLTAVIANLRASLSSKEVAREKYIANIASQRILISSRTERTSMHEQLANQGWDSRAMVLRSLEPLRQEQVSLASLEGSLEEANAAIPIIQEQIINARNAFVADNTARKAGAERQVDDLEQQLAEADLALKNKTLRAVVSGIVQSLAITSTGQALKVGEQVMQIVPDETPLEVRAYVLNSDIGFVRKGQLATIKIDTFPYTRYGTIKGWVTYVGADASTGAFAMAQQKNGAATPSAGSNSVTNVAPRTADLVFPVTIVPDQSWITVEGRHVSLTSGMSVVVEIETERQRVISYILYPLTRVWRSR